MSSKPIFVATHPRACSTAFERVFMTRRDALTCVHEPFGDAFYFGPERLSSRYEEDEQARQESGFANSTYKDIFDQCEIESQQSFDDCSSRSTSSKPAPLPQIPRRVVRINIRLHSPFNTVLGVSAFFVVLYWVVQRRPVLSDENRARTHHQQGKRLFIKDILHYLVPPDGKPASIAPSLLSNFVKRGVGTDFDCKTNGFGHGLANGISNGTSSGIIDGVSNGTSNGIKRTPYPYGTPAEPDNPTVVPSEMLKKFHFTFLIRHPRSSIPSYYRCTIPPLDKVTGFYDFMPSEAGYDELRRVFDFLRSSKQVGPALAGQYTGSLPDGQVSITVVDADDLLDDPEGIIKAYCKEVGLDYHPDMLDWDSEEDHARAKDAFEKWRGFHNDAIESTNLKARTHRKTKTIEVEDQEWREKYGEEAQKTIRKCVNANIPDYEYLKSFSIKV